MYKVGARVRIQLPETISVPTSNTALVMKRVSNQSPYQGKIAVVTGENYKTSKQFDEEEIWYFVKVEDMSSMPTFVKNQMISFPESALFLV